MEDLKTKLITFAVMVFSAIGIYIGGYYHGKDQAPTKMVETVKVVEKQVTTEAIKELMSSWESMKSEFMRMREAVTSEKYHRETLETKLPDGTYTKKTTVDRNIDSHTKESETKTEVKVVEVERVIEKTKEVIVEKKVDVVKVVENAKPDWEVMAKVGTNVSEFKPQLTVPYFSPLLLGVDVNRRLIGPVKGGAWVMSNTRFDSVSAGLALGVEF